LDRLLKELECKRGIISSLPEGLKNTVVLSDVENVERVLYKAENSHIIGNVKSKWSVLYKAENSHIKGNVESGWSVLCDAKNSYIEGNVESEEDVLYKAENSHIIGNVKSKWWNVLNSAKNSHIIGNVESGWDVLRYAKNSYIEGNVKSGWGGMLYKAENSHIIGNVESGADVLCEAKNSYIIGRKIKVPRIGYRSSGCMVAAERIEAEYIDPNLIVITKDSIDSAAIYEGDWDELEKFLYENVDEEFLEAIGAFGLKGKFDLNGIKSYVKKARKLYKEVKEEIKIYYKLRDVLGLELSGEIEERYNKLKSIHQEIRRKLLKECGNEAVADAVMKSNVTEFWIKNREYLKEFIGDRSKYLLNSGFERGYAIAFEVFDINKDVEEANKRLYREGLKLLDRIKRGEGFEYKSSEIKELVNKKVELRNKIREEILSGKDEKSEEVKKLIEERKKIEKEIKGIQYRERTEILEGLGLLKDKPSIDELKEGLSQLSQHYLKGKIKEMANKISSSIRIFEGNLNTNYVKVKVWNKDISNMPTYEEYRCCAFPGYSDDDYERRIIKYMLDPNTQLLAIEAGDKKGMAITCIVYNKEGRYLLVDSVESGTHIFNNSEIVKAVDKAIKEYAKEAGLNGVIYNLKVGNSAPKEFLDNLAKLGYRKKIMEVKKDGINVYLEADLNYLECYYVEV
jgi:hypothetical protein